MGKPSGLYLSNFNKGGRLSARSEGPTLEARRAESGGGVLGEGAASLGEGAASPLPPARGSGEAL